MSLRKLALYGATATLVCTGSAWQRPADANVPASLGFCTRATVAGAFAGDDAVDVLAVKPFAAGERLGLRGRAEEKAKGDLCLVKLLVDGSAPGRSQAQGEDGIGLEIWLPGTARWNGRIHNVGGGGFAGGREIRDPDATGGFPGASSYDVAAVEGAISGITDTGHVTDGGNGAFLMTADGGIDRAQWTDFAHRSNHELAVKTKALAVALYGRAANYAYFDGCSTGGRQGHMEAQRYPEDYDGILAGAPAVHWSRFITSELYPQLLMARQLSRPLTPAQLTLASSKAVSACDARLNGRHDGYISDPASCRYDPATDRSLLCISDGGTNATNQCLTRVEAQVVNRIWYGQTRDGSAPSPRQDNGYGPRLGRSQIWFGLPRGTTLDALAGSADGKPRPFPIAVHLVALNLQDAALADPGFRVGARSGADGWRRMSLADLARASSEGTRLQPDFAGINADNPDLSAFKARGGKLLVYHGMADQLIPIQGTTHYVDRVTARMGGKARTQSFYRYYQIPGMAHCFGVGSVDGEAGVSPKAEPPMPAPRQLYDELVEWVEKGAAPQTIVMRNQSGTRSRPICLYPAKIRYRRGDPDKAESYTCK